jgi:predicted nucleic acid-binding protein
MGKNLLLDTDILIDWLHGFPWARDLLSLPRFAFYYSTVTQKELLSKSGLSGSERKTIVALLGRLRWIPITPDIAAKAAILLDRYARQGLKKHDALIAATAWSKGFTLFTRNRRHFEFVREIDLLKLPT